MSNTQGNLTSKDIKKIAQGEFGPTAFNENAGNLDRTERITASTNDALRETFQEATNDMLMHEIFDGLEAIISANIVGLQGNMLFIRESFFKWFMKNALSMQHLEKKFGLFCKEQFLRSLLFALHARMVQAHTSKLIVSGLSSEALDKFFVGIFNETLAGFENEYDNSEPELSKVGADTNVIKDDKESEGGEPINIHNAN